VAITLRIDNIDRLPDGGPIEFSAGPRGFDIGRQQHLDWCLPDPDRVVSGLHCQVRYENGAYWLNDVSSNGTFVNGAPDRVKSPYLLQNGDRLQIGSYIISVMIGGAERQQQAPEQQYTPPPSNDGDLWGAPGGAAPQPVDRRWFVEQQRRDQGYRAPDVLDEYVDLPPARRPAPQYDPGPFGGGGRQFAQPQQQQPPQQPAYQAPAAYSPVLPNPGQQFGAPGMAGQGMSAETFLQILSQAAGVNPQTFASRSPELTANELGNILRTVAEGLAGLLKGRAKVKQMTKSGNRTMIGADRNNALKFIPNPAEALEIMFLQNRPGYLSASDSVKEGIDDIRRHEKATVAAMQKALFKLMEDLDPDRIEEKAGSGGFGGKKAKAWEIYEERWKAKTEHHENGMLDVFLAYFADAYDAASKE
jgi:type VI secretion system protein ImpI